MRIRVTNIDIMNADFDKTNLGVNYSAPNHCPIAHALQRYLKDIIPEGSYLEATVEVSGLNTHIDLWDLSYHALSIDKQNTEPMMAFINAYDSGLQVSALSFYIDLKPILEYVKMLNRAQEEGSSNTI